MNLFNLLLVILLEAHSFSGQQRKNVFLGMLSSVLIGVPIGDLRHWGACHLLWNRACRLFGAQWPKFSGYWALRKRVRRGGSIACGSDIKDDCFPALKHYLDTESFGCTAPTEPDTYGEDLLRVHEASRKRSEARLRAEKATAAALLRRVRHNRHTSQNQGAAAITRRDNLAAAAAGGTFEVSLQRATLCRACVFR